MRKFLIYLITVLLLFNICACQKKKPENDIDINCSLLEKIFELDGELYDAKKEFNHRNTISNQAQHLKEDSANPKITLKINGTDKEWNYYDTLYFPIGERKVHRYSVASSEDESVLIYSDGSINALLCDFAFLNISKKALPDEVRLLLEIEMNKWLNVSDYEYVKMPNSPNDSAEEFGIYDYLFYNMIDGYMTNYVSVSVSDEGAVFALKKYDLSTNIASLNVDRDREKELLNLKLSDIFNTNKTEYKSYNIVSSPIVVMYDNELYIQYFVSANYVHETYGEMKSWINTILIPTQFLQQK